MSTPRTIAAAPGVALTSALLAGAMLALSLSPTVGHGQTAVGELAGCPWMVYVDETELAALEAAGQSAPTVRISMDDGDRPATDPRLHYAFTVNSPDLAWQVARGDLGDLESNGRPLARGADGKGRPVYGLATDTAEPHTIYLVASDMPVRSLEQIGARIDPGLKFRGASPVSGPLPVGQRVTPFEVVAAQPAQEPGVQVCAYQAAFLR